MQKPPLLNSSPDGGLTFDFSYQAWNIDKEDVEVADASYVYRLIERLALDRGSKELPR